MSWNCKSSRKEVSGIKVELWSSFIKRETRQAYTDPQGPLTLWKICMKLKRKIEGKGRRRFSTTCFFFLFSDDL